MYWNDRFPKLLTFVLIQTEAVKLHKNFDYFEHSLHATRETFWVKILCFLSKGLNGENPYRNNLNQNDKQPLVQSIHTLYLLVFKELWTVVLARPVSFTEQTLSLLSCLTCFTGVIGFLNFQNERKKRKKEKIPVTDILPKKYQQI